VALLARVAALTGGRMDPAPADVVTARAGRASRGHAARRILVPLVLALFLAGRRARGGSRS
jgi:hypothetical protein